jgi:D-alanyl-lipoteichoic acid acyltransferase DltB (MBOAT superfamily)
MIFNSINYAIFLPVVFFLYWFATNKILKAQNVLLLLSSYFFYACWDWRFLFLLMFSTLLDYFTGIRMDESKNNAIKKFWFWLSICINLGFLGVFKYYNFFVTSLAEAVSNLGLQINPVTLQVILPVGISFYTFHGLSYVIDIYKGRIKAERNFIDYSVFVSFFPLLVAGPIERATHLLPQIQQERVFDYHKCVDGLRQILWGLFKKIVVADQCAEYANQIFSNPAHYPGATLFLGAVFFAIQIYGDFSGYSDIALGTARLFGIELLRNFAFPYFSRDIAEFWRRWHISLSTWFRDYLYIPLGGSKVGTWIKVRNTFIIFLISGFWHGANWTFIIWGLLNAIYIIPSVIFKTNRNNIDIVARGKNLPTLRELLNMLLTFGLVVLAWIFFRAENLTHAFQFIRGLISSPASYFSIRTYMHYGNILMVILLMMIIEWMGREQQYALERLGINWKRPLRWSMYYVMTVAIMLLSSKGQTFIYFQF